ncbi:MAG TPA: hypothetical protein VKB58_05680 [Terriglobales bacterium]|nr:hypothetical protein [Terriglobales bacterium]
MTTQSNAMSDTLDVQRAAAALSPTCPLYWSVRRELMENRWIYLGQLAVAALFLFGFLITTVHLPAHVRALSGKDPMQSREALASHYEVAAGVMMGTLILMCLFYCADALHGERRDRSILFWKSLPVSDLTTVLAKASVPLVVLPLLTFSVIVGIQLVMLLVSSIVLGASGAGVGLLWRQLSIFQMWGQILYHLLTAHALWPFPVFCWLLLVSGWARRAPLLWAALPVVAIAGIEKLVFNSSHFVEMVVVRMVGGNAPTDYTPGSMFPMGPMTHLTPGRFLGAPGLWIGFAFAAIFLAVAVRLRRCRGPI